MARSAHYIFVAALAAFFCLALDANAAQASQAPVQTSPAAAASPASNNKSHGIMPAELTKSLDSKKLKEGDPVEARITAELRMREGETIPRGSKLTGHVTEAKARSKGDPEAALGIAFDKITTPNGKDMAIKGVLQAVGPSLSSGAAGNAAERGPGPGIMARSNPGSGGTTPQPMPGLSQDQQSSGPVLNGQSKGVVGIRNLELGDNSVLRSGGKEVKLDSGMQLIVQVEFE